MKKALCLFLALTLNALSFAADTRPVEETFNRYWSAVIRKDFATVAAETLPSDLEAAKAAILPVFLAAQSNPAKEAQQIVTAFFGRTVGKARETLSPQEVLIGLNRVVVASNPDFFEILKNATTTIVIVQSVDENTANLHYQVTLRGESDMDVEQLVKKNGRWWVRVKDDPRQLAEEFKMMLSPKQS